MYDILSLLYDYCMTNMFSNEDYFIMMMEKVQILLAFICKSQKVGQEISQFVKQYLKLIHRNFIVVIFSGIFRLSNILFQLYSLFGF